MIVAMKTRIPVTKTPRVMDNRWDPILPECVSFILQFECGGHKLETKRAGISKSYITFPRIFIITLSFRSSISLQSLDFYQIV